MALAALIAAASTLRAPQEPALGEDIPWSQAEDFDGPSTVFTLAEGATVSARLEDGSLVMRSEREDYASGWLFGPSDKWRLEPGEALELTVDAQTWPGTGAGLGLTSGERRMEWGAEVMTILASDGGIYLFRGTQVIGATDAGLVDAAEGARLVLSMRLSQDGSEHFVTTYLLDELDDGTWVEAADSRLTATVPAMDVTTAFLMVHPERGGDGDEGWPPARASFDNFLLDATPAG